ncbi:MAG: tRNA guanosine(34) transglycosylase Tgt [Actinobacteria bacterium]|nr:tRNA guanosine(34) transglycosylase Tgt [Actinomycetota bacterium]
MFAITKKSKILSARSGSIKTIHGNIKVPFFMPDATRGFIKSLSNGDLEKLKMGPMVVNTYHLYLRPGIKKIKKAEGIHKFMNWGGPLLSDSGGFQVFSLIHQNPQMGKITDKEVIFRSPIDGSKHIITPEKSIQIQFDLGVDMMVTLDDCPSNDCKKKDLREAVARTVFWAKRCAKEYDKQIVNRQSSIENYRRPLIFAVIQGGADLELRKKCFEGLQEAAPKNGWDGFGYGARPVDAKGNFLGEVLEYTANLIPENKIRFALGVGTPEDIVRCAKMGWDMFDCVIPTREGRHGRLFNWKKNYKSKIITQFKGQAILKQTQNSKLKTQNFYNTVNIINSKFASDFSPINKDSKLKELREHSKAYLHHLFKLKEPLGQRLAAMNNLEFYLDLMEMLRK